MLKTKIFLLSALILCLCSSCKDFLNLVPKNERVVSTVDDVRSELLVFWAAYTYSSVPLPSYGQSVTNLPVYNDINAHWAMYTNDLDMLRFKDHADITSKVMAYYYEDVDWKGMSLAASIWNDSYSTIGLMNTVIDDLAGIPAAPAEAQPIDGEARTIRAYCLFKLLQCFAPYHSDELGVPLNLDSENVTPGGRRSQLELYHLLEEELLEVLEYKAPRAEWNFFYSPRFIKSLLAEIYLFKAGSAAAESTDYEKAEKYSGEVIEGYTPEDRPELLTEMFSAENIAYNTEHPYCALKLATQRYCSIGDQTTGIWGLNNAQQVSDELWSLYAPKDIRRKAWFNETEVEGEHIIYVAKPQIKSAYQSVSDILVLYRKADLYLMNAEAKCHTGKKAEAAQMLFTFRQARIPGYDTPIAEDVLSEIMTERRRELCFENGSRWFDMKRTGSGCTRPGYDRQAEGTKTYILKADDYRFALPIPQGSELDYNNQLTQNPGWKDFN